MSKNSFANPFEELKEILNCTMLACEGNGRPVEVMAVLEGGCKRAIDIAENALLLSHEDVSTACLEVCEFIKDLSHAYEQKVYCAMLNVNKGN